jgi:hypothetical protein
MNVTIELSFNENQQDLKFLLDFKGGVPIGYAIGMYDSDRKTLLWGPLKGSNSDKSNIYPLSLPLSANKGRFIKVNFVITPSENNGDEGNFTSKDDNKYEINAKIQQQGLIISEKMVAAGEVKNSIEEVRLLVKLI